MKRIAAFTSVGVCIVAAIVCVALLRDHTVHGPPWVALAVVLMAAGAVGLVVLVVAHAHALESEQAQPPRRGKSA
jgi:uncharacterized protein (DUF983 family)